MSPGPSLGLRRAKRLAEPVRRLLARRNTIAGTGTGTRSLDVIATLACASFPIRVKFTPDGKRVLVSNARSGDVVVFDARKREELRRIKMEVTAVEKRDERLFGDKFGECLVPVGILIPADGGQAYVANTNADIITVIDLKSLEITARLRAGKEPDGLGFTPLDLRQNAPRGK